MALRAVPEHPKFFALKDALHIRKYHALGILEALWHFAGKFAPRGNVGKFKDSEIEGWLEWDGERGALVAALTDVGWLDKSEEHRLVIHDWHEHADQTTRKQLGRTKTAFVSYMSGQVIDMSRQNGKVSGPPVPVPVPEPVPVTEPKTLASTALAVPAARGKLVCTLPLNAGNHEVFDADVQEWIPLYPAVDIRQELRTMKGWLLGSPQRRKTKSGIGRFINAWFARAQNESRPGAGNGTTQGNHKPNAAVDRQRITHDAIRAAAIRRYGAGIGHDDGGSSGGEAEPDTAPGDAGCVPPGMGGDSPEVRFDDFQGRTLEGTP